VIKISLPIFQVLDRFKFPPPIEADIQFFTCLSQDPVYGGSTHLRTGSIVGLPANFAYRSIDDIDKTKLQIGQKLINWDSPEGKLFADSLILSDNAKRFVIARQVNYLKSLQVYIDNGFLVFFSLLAYWAGHAANVLLHLKRKLPTWLRVGAYACFASIGVTLYFLAKDEYFCFLDDKADKRAGEFGKDYMAGGLEYYSKELQRNKALRVILGEYGERIYTPFGNYVSMWRLRHAPPTTRREKMEFFLEKKIKEQISEKADGGVIQS
jgi:hypothetical protein